GDDADDQVIPLVKVIERGGDALGDRRVDGVLRPGPVDGDHADPLVSRHENGVGLRRGGGLLRARHQVLLMVVTVSCQPAWCCCSAFTAPPPMIRRWISLVPSYRRSSRTSR